MALELANPLVTQYVTLAVTRPENQHHLIEPTFRGLLSLADLIVLVHRLGLGQAAGFVAVVDPWKYPDEATTGAPAIKGYSQGAVDKATHAAKIFHSWTEESKTEYLLSPLLSRNRPCLVRIPKTARAKSGSTSVMPVLPVSPPTALAMPGLTPAPTEPAIVQLLAPVLAEGTPPPPLALYMNQPPLDVSRSVGGNSGKLAVALPLTLPSYLAGEDGAPARFPPLLVGLGYSRPRRHFPLSKAALCTPSVPGYHGVSLVYCFCLNCLPLLSGENWARGDTSRVAMVGFHLHPRATVLTFRPYFFDGFRCVVVSFSC